MFYSNILFYDDYDIPVHTCYLCSNPCFLNLISSLYSQMLILARHLAFALYSPGEFHLTPLDSHVQVLELGACGFSLIADQSGATVAWISCRLSGAPSF